MGMEQRVRSASQELTSYLRSSENPGLLVLVDGQSLTTVAGVALKVEVVQIRD